MIKKCLFPAAGYGTRFLPATKSMPKEMMPIINKPLIEYGVEEARDAGMHEICLVTGRGKRILEDHFDINFELEHQINGIPGKEALLQNIRQLLEDCSFSYTRQRVMRGLGHAILTGRRLIEEHPFGVILADDLCLNLNGISVLAQMKKLYQQFRCSIVAVQEVPENEVHKYGIITGTAIKDNILRVTSMIEKPNKEQTNSNLAIIGRYILTPDIFNLLENTPPDKSGEIQITDALKQQAEIGCVIAYKFKGVRFDCGNIEGFIKATNYCYKHFYLSETKIKQSSL